MDDVTDASLFKEEPIDDEIDMQENCEILTVCEVHKLMEAEISKVQSIVEVTRLAMISWSQLITFCDSFQAAKARFAGESLGNQMGY